MWVRSVVKFKEGFELNFFVFFGGVGDRIGLKNWGRGERMSVMKVLRGRIDLRVTWVVVWGLTVVLFGFGGIPRYRTPESTHRHPLWTPPPLLRAVRQTTDGMDPTVRVYVRTHATHPIYVSNNPTFILLITTLL